MIRVIDLDKSIAFYCDYFQMKLIRRKDYPGGEFTLAFLGYGEEHNSTVIELTYNWGRKDNYDLGNGFGHLAIGVPDIYKTCKKLADAGLDIPRPPRSNGSRWKHNCFYKRPRWLFDRTD